MYGAVGGDGCGEMGRGEVIEGLVGYAMEFSWKSWGDIEECHKFREAF